MHTTCPGNSPLLLLGSTPAGSLFLTFIYSLWDESNMCHNSVCSEVREQLSEISCLLMGPELGPSSLAAVPPLADHLGDPFC